MGSIGAVRSSAWICDFSSTHSTTAFSGGAKYNPTTSMTLATSSGSVENLNVSTRHGVAPYSRQALATVAFPIPRCRASNLEDQCVTPYLRGGGASVAATTSRCSTVRGLPERGSSSSPGRPLSRYRLRQPTTVTRDTPTLSAIEVFDSPSGSQQQDPGPLRQPRPHAGRASQPDEFLTVTFTQ